MHALHPRTRGGATPLLALVAGLLGLVAIGAGPAAAHDSLKSTDPAASSTVDTLPDAVTLTFNEAVNPDTFTSDQVAFTGPGGTFSINSITAIAGSNNTRTSCCGWTSASRAPHSSAHDVAAARSCTHRSRCWVAD